MTRWNSAVLLLSFLAAALLRAEADPAGTAVLDAQARRLVRDFVGSMKPLLRESVQQHGAAGAIDICAEEAPRIARRLAADSGWEISRVSTRPRNVDRAQPDAWERDILALLEERTAAGATAAQLNHGEVVDGRFRYMQGQPTESLCLLCHGSNQVTPDVRAAIAQRYPDDRATGFTLGELRGAISLRAPADP